MKLAIMQPYFFPYIGYFQMLAAVDRFVIYDDVSYIKNGWINRNRILMNGMPSYFTIQLKGASSNKLINEVEVNEHPNWKKKLFRTLEVSYSRAPYFKQVMEIVEKVFEYSGSTVASWASNSIDQVKTYLEISTETIPSSAAYTNQHLSGTERVLDICKQNGAGTYINPIGGRYLYQKENFAQHGISLYFIETQQILYSQFPNHSFVPHLSILDVLMFNSTEVVHGFLKSYKLL